MRMFRVIFWEVTDYTNVLYNAHKLCLNRGNCSESLYIFFFILINVITDSKTSMPLVRWLWPQLNWVKLNTNGASRGNPDISGRGGVLRAKHGVYLGGFGKFIGAQISVSANASTILDGLRFAVSPHLTQIWIELDRNTFFGNVFERYRKDCYYSICN